MASAAERVTWQDIVIFWAKVVAMCLVLGVVSFYIGRRYLGTMFSEAEIEQGAPEIVVQVQDSAAEAEEAEKPPPEKAKVEIEEREGSEAEAARANREFVATEQGADAEEAADTSAQGAAQEGETEGTSQWSDYTSEQADSESGAASAEETATTPSGRYVVIAGSFLNPENSQRMLQELKSKGYQPYLTKATVGDKTYRRVNVGAFANRQQADKLAEELAAAGYEVTVGVR